ncbi:MAG: hypothetical protein JNK87_20130 [Bryobacterales bacterium]|nr:hypothetical protein [Bryobacterales bacterium]
MSQVATLVSNALLGALDGENGLRTWLGDASRLGELARNVTVVGQHIDMDLADRSPQGYPAVYVHCDRVTNSLREKFRSFAGTAELGVDVRATAERAEETTDLLHYTVDGLIRVLESVRGDWGAGMYYGGGYEVTYQALKKGGRNFVKTAKVKLTVEVSKS